MAGMYKQPKLLLIGLGEIRFIDSGPVLCIFKLDQLNMSFVSFFIDICQADDSHDQLVL